RLHHMAAQDFFFQAEDGIRDFHVTGVQTCALPISPACRGGTLASFSATPPPSRSGLDAQPRFRAQRLPTPRPPALARQELARDRPTGRNWATKNAGPRVVSGCSPAAPWAKYAPFADLMDQPSLFALRREPR